MYERSERKITTMSLFSARSNPYRVTLIMGWGGGGSIISWGGWGGCWADFVDPLVGDTHGSDVTTSIGSERVFTTARKKAITNRRLHGARR